MKIGIITCVCLLLFALIYSCQSDDSIEFKRYFSAGSQVYQSHCQNCHGTKGEGLAALIPPLNDTSFLKSIKNKLPCIIQNGFKGKITVAGKNFDGTMPPTGLTPIEIAQVITYVGNSFGNKMGIVTDDNINTALGKCN
jgi:mono/diheme cytochrome c family protein